MGSIQQYAYFVSYWITGLAPRVGNSEILLNEKIESGDVVQRVQRLIAESIPGTVATEQIIITNWIRLHDDDVWSEDAQQDLDLAVDITPDPHILGGIG